MTADPFKLAKGLQKGLKGLAKKLGKSKNPKFQEMKKRLLEIDKKVEEKFEEKPKKEKQDEN